MNYTWELDEDGVLWVWLEDGYEGVPALKQPTHPDGTAWTSLTRCEEFLSAMFAPKEPVA